MVILMALGIVEEGVVPSWRPRPPHRHLGTTQHLTALQQTSTTHHSSCCCV